MFQGKANVDALRTIGRVALPPSWRFAMIQAKHGLDTGLARASLWRWERAALRSSGAVPFLVEYVGRPERRWQVCELLGLREEAVAATEGDDVMLAGDMPLPGSLRIPYHLDAVVPLGRTLDEVMAGYDAELRRQLVRQQSRMYARRVTAEAEIERVQREMLEPYGFARHGEHALNMSLEVVQRLALRTGRLDAIYLDNEEVGCHLGYSVRYRGKSYWVTMRFGYPERVFGDPKRLREANSATAQWALAWAIDSGFDCYNLGMSPASPDGGLLEWKRRRGGELSTLGADDYFRLRLPDGGRARLLWQAPLFSVERGRVTLHLGVPASRSDEQVRARYRQMGFGGLSAVHLYCERPPGSALLRKLGDLYSRYPNRPHLVELAG